MHGSESTTHIHLDRLAEKVGGRYRLTKLISERMRQLNGGAPLLVDLRPHERLISAVCREVEEGLISLDVPELADVAEQAEFDVLGIEGGSE